MMGAEAGDDTGEDIKNVKGESWKKRGLGEKRAS